MKKSHVSFILAAALAAALLAGCGSSGSSADASGSGKAGASPRHRIRGARPEVAAEQRERFRVRLRSGIHLPRGQDWRPSRRRQTNLWKKTRM